MNLVRLLILLGSASFCVGLMVWHAWRTRGRNVAVGFFLACTIYAVIRGKMVYLLTVGLTDSGFPYIFSEQLIKIFNEPVMTIVGWNFAIYLSWCLAELILDKLRISRSNVFALSVFAFLVCASISYVVESAAGKANWWQWGMSTKNGFFADVPVVGIVDWAAIISDFLLPFLLFIHPRIRKSAWKYLLFLPFAFHMFSHSPIVNDIPVLFTCLHVLIFLILLFLALFPSRLFKGEESGDPKETNSGKSAFRIFSYKGVPFISWLILLLVTIGVQLIPAVRPEGFISFGPILMIGALSFFGLISTFILSPVIIILSFVHDFRWLAALAVPLAAFLMKYSLMSPADDNIKTVRWRLNPRLIKGFTIVLFIALNAWAVGAGAMLRMKSDQYTADLQAFLAGAAGSEKNQPELVNLIDTAPADATFLMKIAEILTENGAPPPVIMAHLERAIETDPRYILPYDALGLIRFETGDYDGAIETINTSLEYRVSEAGPYINLATVYAGIGEHDKALEYCRKAIAVEPENPAAFNELGRTLAGMDRRDEAVTAFRKAVELNNDYLEALFNLGIAYTDNGETDSALLCYSQALQLNPEYVPALFNAGNLLQKTGQPDEAAGYFKKVISLSPEYTGAYLSLAVITLEKGDHDNTIGYCNKFLELVPRHNRAYFVHYLLARSLYKTEKIEKAVENYREAIKLRGVWPQVSSQLARILALHPDENIRDLQEAEYHALQAVDLSGGNQPEALDTQAMVRAAAGRFDEAVELSEKALKLAVEKGNEELAGALRERLELYKNKKVYRPVFAVKD